MKKLLLSLFAVATVFVACDKDSIDAQDATIVNLEETVVSSEIDTETGDLFIDFILNNINNLPTSKKGTASNSSKGSDYVNVVVYSEGGFTYLALLDETNDDVCFNNIAESQFFWDNSAGDGSILRVEDSDENLVREVRGDFSAFFALGLNSISQLTLTSSDLTINGSSDLSDINTATVEGADVNFICAEGKYTVTAAPFPLQGFLATVIDQNSFMGTSLNYAGTDRNAVEAAIEANIIDGN